VRESPASSIKPGTEGELSLREAGHADAPGARVERLYCDYAGRIYRYCLSRLDSPEEAEDALQATYLNAWRSLNSGVEPLSSRPWLFQIAANVCASMLRTRLGGAAVELRSPETFDRIPTNVEPNDDLLGLSAALAGLPERQRHALLLRDWRGLSYDEIAAEMGSSYQAVETLLFRARKSVAAGLQSPEPVAAKVPVRARALAPLPFLLPLKDGLASIKSALGTSVAPIKVSLGVALGAAAPLVAYGVLERGIENTKPAITAAAPKVQVQTPLTYTMPVPRVETEKKPDVPAEKRALPSASDPAPVTHGGESSGVSAAGHAHESGPGPGQDPAPPPEPTTDPPAAEEEPPPSKVTICHHTGSKKNPTVTITVGADAVEAFLAKGDELGACAE